MVKVGTSVFFTYDVEECEREIESVRKYKNYSWIGELGFGGNVMFLVHGNLDEQGEPIMEGLVIQVDGVNGSTIHEYVRDGITYKENN